MICPACNAPNRDDAKFCKKCGHSFRTEAVSASVATDVAQPEQPAQPAQQPDVQQTSQPSGVEDGKDGNSDNSESLIQVSDGNAVIAPPEASAATNERANGDISMAPTQIISHEKMAAYHARRWQEEEQNLAPTREATTSQEGQPVLHATPQASVPQSDIAEVPTVLMNPSSNEWPHSVPPSSPAPIAEDEPIPIPPPPPPESLSPTGASAMDMNENEIGVETAGTGESPYDAPEETGIATASTNAAEEQKLAATIAASQHTDSADATKATEVDKLVTPEAGATEEGSVSNTEITPEAVHSTETADQGEQPAQVDQPDPSEGADTFPVLAVGTLLNDRYEVTEVVSDDAAEHLYHVIDRHGYQHCWNCASEQNSEGDEFCINCGADLFTAVYTLHEYPASASADVDANVLRGTIINTFVDHGYTYVVEQEHAEQNAFPNGVHLIAAGDSDAGDVRRSEPNEDSILVLTFQRIHESVATPSGVFIVADGMGGHDNGQLASHMAIATIAERMTRELILAPLSTEKAGEEAKPMDEEGYVGLLRGSVEDANAAICNVNQQKKTDMGSTITGFMLVGDHAYILNVGDSRTYMMRGGQIYQLTNDHSLVGQLVAGGLIQPDDVYTHPQRSQIFRSLGDKLNVQIDIFKQQVHPGDILLSCSDGLWEMVRNPQIESILNNAPDPQAACTQLLETANTNGGEDNVSAVVAFIH